MVGPSKVTPRRKLVKYQVIEPKWPKIDHFPQEVMCGQVFLSFWKWSIPKVIRIGGGTWNMDTMNILLPFPHFRPITAGFSTGSFERFVRGKHHCCLNTDEVRVCNSKQIWNLEETGANGIYTINVFNVLTYFNPPRLNKNPTKQKHR